MAEINPNLYRPDNLHATVMSTNHVNLIWDDNSNEEDGFIIERSDNGNNYVVLTTTDPNLETYLITNHPVNTRYYYRIKAYKDGDESYASNTISVSNNNSLVPPGNLIAKAVSNSQIDLFWVDNCSVETGFVIEKSTNGGFDGFETIQISGADQTTYIDTDVNPSTAYYYRIKVVFGNSDSDYSNLTVAATADVIAHWDIVPFQKLTSPFKAGVVAFHEVGVNVEFFINGDSKGVVSEPTYNDRTNVYEYWFELNPSDYPDGIITLSAVCSPDTGSDLPRILPDLILYANANGSLNNNTVVWADGEGGDDVNGTGDPLDPFKTIETAYAHAGDGGTVYLKAGNYNPASINIQNTYWTTVSAAPGVSRNQVHIRFGQESNSQGRINANRIKWENVSLYRQDAIHVWGCMYRFESNHHVWFNNVSAYDANGYDDNEAYLFNPQGGYPYITNSLIRDIGNAGGASAFAQGNEFWRDSTFRNIGCDVWRAHSNLFAVNINIDHMTPYEASHPDYFQTIPHIPSENIILYNIKIARMYGQGIATGGRALNIAFVNMFVERPMQYSSTCSIDHMEHFLLWHSNFHGVFVDIHRNNSNWSIHNNIFQRFFHEVGTVNPAPTTVLDSTITHNHFVGSHWNQTDGLMGSDYTSGNPGYKDPCGSQPMWWSEKNYDDGQQYNIGDIVYKNGESFGYYQCTQDHRAYSYNPAPPGVGQLYDPAKQYKELPVNSYDSQGMWAYTSTNICTYNGLTWRAVQDCQGVTPVAGGAYWAQIGDWQGYWQPIQNLYDLGEPYNYHLLASSPAYRAGIALECVPADIDGNLFYSGSPCLGAHSSIVTNNKGRALPSVLLMLLL